MTPHDLADALRARQRVDLDPDGQAKIDAMLDRYCIVAHITCSCCGRKQVTRQVLRQCIAEADDVEHFLELCTTRSSLDHGLTAWHQ